MYLLYPMFFDSGVGAECTLHSAPPRLLFFAETPPPKEGACRSAFLQACPQSGTAKEIYRAGLGSLFN